MTTATVKTVWLDELDISKAVSGWLTAQRNKSLDGHTLTIPSKQFERGIGLNAVGEFCIQLDGNAERFSGMVGLDDGTLRRGSVGFVVIGDGKGLFRKEVMRSGDAAVAIDVPLRGVKLLRLLTTDGGDGIDFDQGDWVSAKIDYAGAKPEMIEPIRPKPYILTPKAGPMPRITGPKVFGVRPGSPFLFTVTAVGERPMTFEVKGLPEGLTLDSKTGRITGVLKTKGEYVTTVIATNAKGKADRSFKIVVGDTIALTPPMGWNSWNCWGCAVSDEKVRATAKAMVDSGLANHGWSYINIDDGWARMPKTEKPTRTEDGRILCNDKFPDMAAMTEYIHGLGLKVGIYTSPEPLTCAFYAGSWRHEHQDAQQYADWGFDYLKYDWCSDSPECNEQTLDILKKPYILMGNTLKEVGRDIVFSLCQYGMGDVWKWSREIGGQCSRTTPDVLDSWNNMASIGFNQAEHYPYAGPGHWNDPDMLVVGKVGWGPDLRSARLTSDEQYTHISLWCLLSAPLLIGCPIEEIDEFTMSLLTNDEVLGVDQDPLGKQAWRMKKTDEIQVWAKELEDGSKAVGFFNMNGDVENTAEIDWVTLGLKSDAKYSVRDLWRQKDLGTVSGSYAAQNIPPHGVLLVRLFAK